jgi:hypothetical protein
MVLDHDSVDDLVRENIVELAERELLVFTGSAGSDVYARAEIIQEWRTTLSKPRIHATILFGPTLDRNSRPFFEMIQEFADKVNLFVVREDKKHEFVDKSTGHYVFKHFLVADERHLCVEEIHVSAGKEGNAWREYQDYPLLARKYAKLHKALIEKASRPVPLDVARMFSIEESAKCGISLTQRAA